jgi:cytidylate kinase
MKTKDIPTRVMRAASGGRFVVTIDGPAGAGKSTVARELARRLGFTFVDTGALYRTVGIAATRAGVSHKDGRALSKLLSCVLIEMRPGTDRQLVFLDERDVTEEIRTPEASMAASAVSAVPEVRAGLLDLQRRLALAGEARAVIEGRDTGTVIFPDADMKFYMDATPEIRARRRFDELKAKGAEVEFEKILAETVERDKNDSTRAVAPLKCPDGAVRVDTSAMNADEVVAFVEKAVNDRLKAEG